MSGLPTLFCCLLLIVSWPEASSIYQLKNTWDTFEIALSLYFGVDAGKTIKEYFGETESSITEGESTAISKLNELSQDVQAAKTDILFKISDQLRSKLSENINSLFQMAADVEFVYKRYVNIFKNMRSHSVVELLDFANTTTLYQHNLINGLQRIMFRMHEVLINGDDKLESTLSIINKESSQLGVICSRNESSQQLIYDLYNLIVDTHRKGLQIRKFGFTLRQEYEKQSYQRNIDDDLKEFKEAVIKTHRAVEIAMVVAPRTLYRCNPTKWLQGGNYEQLGPVLQTHIVVSSDLTGDSGSCNGQNIYKHSYYSDFSRNLEVSKRCHEGHIRDCKPFGPDFEVCYSAKSSPRVYDWAKPSDIDIFGYKNISSCSNMTKEESLDFLRKKFQNHCLCTCDSGRRAEDRYFSVREVKSDSLNNKFVTGVQLVKIGRVFYIKIQEGEFGLHGNIQGEPVWKNVPGFQTKNQWKEISNDATSTTREKIPYTDVYNDEVQKYKFNTVFHKNPYLYPITYDWSKVHLDEINVGKNEVITGFRFLPTDDGLILQVRATPFDYDDGTLEDSESHWIDGKSFQGVRQEILLNDPEVPSSSDPRAELQISGNGQYVRFTSTDNRKDLGQNTVPFIDTQPITMSPPIPLTGAGLILKRSGHSGGFLALQLKHYDLVPPYD